MHALLSSYIVLDSGPGGGDLYCTPFQFPQEFTNYHFDCKPDALHGALQRFSQFFVAPLCKADALEREVNAVDNEFSGRLL